MMSKQISVAFLLSECDPGKDNYYREEEDLYLFHVSVYLDNRATPIFRCQEFAAHRIGSVRVLAL